MWCVVADNGDEFWVYGVFLDKQVATESAEKLQIKNPEIEYNVADWVGPPVENENGEQGKGP